MTRNRGKMAVIVGGVLILSVAAWAILAGREVRIPDTYVQVGRAARISPDYCNCVIPPNIAPLNAMICEPGREYCVRIHAAQGDPIVVGSRNGEIRIPLKPWRALLQANRGQDIAFDIYVRHEDDWRRFETIRNHVAREPVDPYLVYRLLAGPNHSTIPCMGLQERHIESFEERWLLPYGRDRCINCHTFLKNDPACMLFHVRGDEGNAMLFAGQDDVDKVSTVTRFNRAPAAFSAWHPSGKAVAFSMNKARVLHTTAGESRAAIDAASDLGVYLVETSAVVSTRAISRADRRESYPTWSPDGRYLYFVRGAMPSFDAVISEDDIDDLRQVKYDLMRIRYDVDTGQWGDLETVLSGDELGLSISQPRISPDGRFLLFTAAEHGGFPIYLDTDLYMLDLESGEYWPLVDANSDQNDSWHSWSANGRWVAFASRRRDHQLAKLYFTYIDADGQASKPVLLPQKDPTHYDWRLLIYNLPELVSGPVQVTQAQLLQGIRSSPTGRQADAISAGTVDAHEERPPPTPDAPSIN